ncbi:uncharacterized protein [Asterias amurensis]|uniref:uncharacterized protein isoform X2 n=1 Tax=Asterias amurensis TaxID=7602 RepID=UPI003AB22566
MDHQFRFLVVFSICFLQCYATMNDRKLIILASKLSDEECRNLLVALYKKPAYELTHLHLYTGLCYHDLTRWLIDVHVDLPVLKELHQALVQLNRPALGREMLIEVYQQKHDL